MSGGNTGSDKNNNTNNQKKHSDSAYLHHAAILNFVQRHILWQNYFCHCQTAKFCLWGRDLGIKVSNNLKPSQQCLNILKKGPFLAGSRDISVCFNSMEEFRIRQDVQLTTGLGSYGILYSRLVFISPRDIKCIEKIQSSTTKMVHGLKDYS